MENWLYSLLFDYRIFSPQIGRQCDSSLLLQILTLGGEWNSGPWRYVGCGQEPTQLNLFPSDRHPPTGTLPRVLGYPDSSTGRVCVCVCVCVCVHARARTCVHQRLRLPRQQHRSRVCACHMRAQWLGRTAFREWTVGRGFRPQVGVRR